MKTILIRTGIYGNFDVLVYRDGVLIDCLISCAASTEEAQKIANKIKCD